MNESVVVVREREREREENFFLINTRQMSTIRLGEPLRKEKLVVISLSLSLSLSLSVVHHY
jgi:hypothetical protein